MARVKGPLLSIAAHGRLGPRLLFRGGRKAAHAYMPADPAHVNQRPATPAQAAQRSAYRDLLTGWQSLPETDRNRWRALALDEDRAVNGWNLYLKLQGQLPGLAESTSITLAGGYPLLLLDLDANTETNPGPRIFSFADHLTG